VLLITVPTLSPEQNQYESVTQAQKVSTTTEQTKEVVKVVQKTPVKKVVTPPVVVKTENPPQAIPVVQVESQVDFESINQSSQKAIVNILCSTNSSVISPISGTGVIIDPRGIILTNAHIGQFWLLKDYPTRNNVECVIRTGSPASISYYAELMYISPRWIEENKTVLKDIEPKGTGENDFAFLRITGMVNRSKLPESFAFVPPNIDDNIKENETVVLISYPAGFIGGTLILQNLFISSAITTIQKIFTFKENTSDLISIGGTVVSQKGSSGGAVIDKKSTLIGIITTETDGETTSDRSLFAITLAHINRSLNEETDAGLANLLARDPSSVSQTFRNTIQDTLTKLLTEALSK